MWIRFKPHACTVLYKDESGNHAVNFYNRPTVCENKLTTISPCRSRKQTTIWFKPMRSTLRWRHKNEQYIYQLKTLWQNCLRNIAVMWRYLSLQTQCNVRWNYTKITANIKFDSTQNNSPWHRERDDERKFHACGPVYTKQLSPNFELSRGGM